LPVRLLRTLLAGLFLVCLATQPASSQEKSGQAQKSGKRYPLRGVIEALDESAGRLTVNHDKIEGLMAAMTMSYKVDSPDAFKKLKPGDRIEATLSADDLTLHNIRVVPGAPPAKK
jgi:Cu/Ag efflux protein CusF